MELFKGSLSANLRGSTIFDSKTLLLFMLFINSWLKAASEYFLLFLEVRIIELVSRTLCYFKLTLRFLSIQLFVQTFWDFSKEACMFELSIPRWSWTGPFSFRFYWRRNTRGGIDFEDDWGIAGSYEVIGYQKYVKYRVIFKQE